MPSAKGYWVYRRVDEGDEGGQFVSKAYHDRNQGTCSQEWVEIDDDDPLDPEVQQLLHAVKYGLLEEEPENVAEFFMDGQAVLTRLYERKMRSMER
jgi:hypothetical protein